MEFEFLLSFHCLSNATKSLNGFFLDIVKSLNKQYIKQLARHRRVVNKSWSIFAIIIVIVFLNCYDHNQHRRNATPTFHQYMYRRTRQVTRTQNHSSVACMLL